MGEGRRGDEGRSVFFEKRSTCEFPRGRSHCSADFVADERATRKERREEGRMSPRAFVARVWISSRLLSTLECLLYDEREKRRYSCCRDSPGRQSIVGVNLCLVRRLFSRLFTRLRQCRRSRGARVGPTGPARTMRQAHTSKELARFACLSSLWMSSRSVSVGRSVPWRNAMRMKGKSYGWLLQMSSIIDEAKRSSRYYRLGALFFSFFGSNNYLPRVSFEKSNVVDYFGMPEIRLKSRNFVYTPPSKLLYI